MLKVSAGGAAAAQVEDELRDQKAIYDSTVEEMLQLNNNYNELKQVREFVTARAAVAR
jgi:hypothetical protein